MGCCSSSQEDEETPLAHRRAERKTSETNSIDLIARKVGRVWEVQEVCNKVGFEFFHSTQNWYRAFLHCLNLKINYIMLSVTLILSQCAITC